MSVVKLRSKTSKNGSKEYLYLDIYPPVRNPDTGVLQRRHYLKIFLFNNPKDKLETAHNRETMELARNVAALRQLDVQNNRFGFISKRMMNGSFLAFFEEIRDKKKNSSNYFNWQMSIEYFKDFAKGDVKFPEINETFSEEFSDYLLSHPGIGRNKRKIGVNTAVAYFSKYRHTLKLAFKKGLLPINLYELVPPITEMETHREFLFLDELQRLADTPFEEDMFKRACLFSALTGLRYSDVSTLEWSEIRGSSGNYILQFTMEKTGRADYLPVSDQAVKLLGERGEGLVFNGLTYSLVTRLLPKFMKAAGIQRHITFHCFRHTFATLQLYFGTDIVTVSKLLGHKRLETTMIYVKIVDKLKRDASHRIVLRLDGNWIGLPKLIVSNICEQIVVNEEKCVSIEFMGLRSFSSAW